MGCGSCSTGGCSTTGGCGQKGGCATGGCNKLNTYDWFAGMLPPGQSEHDNVYEIRFKNTRKAFFKNVNGLSLITGDFVAVESDRGFDVGQVSLSGVLARLQMKKRKSRRGPGDRVRKIYRRATSEDVSSLQKARSREQETLVRTREIVRSLDLDMKISDVEYQGDNLKAIFYYIADQRVDFRELIKILANEFRIRVEMKQIGLRYESGLVGGIGSCGRELCCSTWLTDFKTVSTAAARYQNLSLNPMKISGQCGRLKCCLNFELDTYMDALMDIPKADKIETGMGMAFLQKTDIFKRVMWFSYAGESTWIAMNVDKVKEMLEMNKAGEKPATLHALDGTGIEEAEEEMDFVDVVGQAVLREDPRRKKRKGKGRGGKGRGGRQQNARNQGGGEGGEKRKSGGGGGRRRGGGGAKKNNENKARNQGGGRGRGPSKPSNKRSSGRGGSGGGQGGSKK